MPKPCVDPDVAAIRAFNRLHTRKIGVVDGIASSPFSLAEDRNPRQSQHGFGAIRPDLWLPGVVPMGTAAEVAFFDRPRIAVAGWVHLVSANLLVQASFDRGLFSHAVLPRGTCWHICTRMREAKRRRFSERALSSCLSLLLADVTRPGASVKQRPSVLQRRAKTQVPDCRQ